MARRRAPTPAHAQTRRGVPAAPDASTARDPLKPSGAVRALGHARRLRASGASPPRRRQRIGASDSRSSCLGRQPLSPAVGRPSANTRPAARLRARRRAGDACLPAAAVYLPGHQPDERQPRTKSRGYGRRRAVRAGGAGRADPDRVRRVTGGAARPRPGGAAALGSPRPAAGRVEEGTGTRTA